MEVIAKTEDGYIIQASKTDVNQILRAVNGSCPETIAIGQRLPAIDYAMTITKVKTLQNNHLYEAMLQRVEAFCKGVVELQIAVQGASAIEI